MFHTPEQALGLNVGNDLLTQFLHSGLFLNNNLIISNFFTNHYIAETSWADEAKQMKMLDENAWQLSQLINSVDKIEYNGLVCVPNQLYPFSKRLFAGTVQENNTLFAVTVC